jgi:uncharacterized protein (TIGR00251 family)
LKPTLTCCWLARGKVLAGLEIKEVGDGLVFTVKVAAGSSRTALSGLYNGMLKVKIAAVPEKGKANQCLVELLAERLGIKKNAVNIISGQTSSVKQIQIQGVSKSDLGRLITR